MMHSLNSANNGLDSYKQEFPHALSPRQPQAS